jgi:hypothetical protein
VIDLDVQKFFDEVSWDLVVKAVQAVTDRRWVLLYVERWLAAPLERPGGALEQRSKGTPQGSAVSPILANLFMHFAFDLWMARGFPGCPFERYAAHPLRSLRGPSAGGLHGSRRRRRSWSNALRGRSRSQVLIRSEAGVRRPVRDPSLGRARWSWRWRRHFEPPAPGRRGETVGHSAERLFVEGHHAC